MALHNKPGVPVVGFFSFTPYPRPIRFEVQLGDKLVVVADRQSRSSRSRRSPKI